MKIPETVYAALTPPQRVSAAILAESRGDDAELRKLIQTCEKKRYLENDEAFSGVMKRMMSASLASENDILNSCLFIVTLTSGIARRAEGEEAITNVQRGMEVDAHLESIASTVKAWDLVAAYLGVQPEELRKATCPRGDLAQYLVDQALRHGVGDDRPEEIFHHLKQIISA